MLKKKKTVEKKVRKKKRKKEKQADNWLIVCKKMTWRYELINNERKILKEKKRFWLIEKVYIF